MDRLERLFNIMIKPGVVIISMIFFVFSYFFLDKPIALYFHAIDAKINFVTLVWLTKIGSNVLYLGPLFILALFFRYLYPDKLWELRVWFLWLCVLIPDLICLLLKVAFGRARPFLLFNEHIYGFYGMTWHAPYWSFPSGHTTTIMGFVFGLCFLFPRYFYGLMILGLMVIFSRIFLTEHYLSDVLASSYLTVAEIGVLLIGLRYKKNNIYNLLKGCK